MLAPDDLDAITHSLKAVYTEMRWADQLVTTGEHFQVFDTGTAATWTTSLRARVALLSKNVEEWRDDKPSVVSLPFSAFFRYQNAFSAASAVLQNDASQEAKVKALDRLCAAAGACLKDTCAARLCFERWVDQAITHLSGIDDSIRDAWAALGGAERKVVELSEQIISIQDELNTLTGVIAPDQLSSQTISSLSTILVNSASLVYSVTIAGLPIPYMSVASTFFTLGKLFYTVFSTDWGIHQKIHQLADYRTELSEAQVALSQAKAVLSSLYDLKLLLASQRGSLLDMEEFWRNEARNITTVRNKFALAPCIPPDDPELRQLPVAGAAWNTLKGSAQALLSNLDQGVDSQTVISITT